MRLNSVKLKNFVCFENATFTFKKLTFIKGKNGAGKTTMSLYSLLFALYGYSPKLLENIPTKNKAKSCTVEIEIVHQGKTYLIKRSFPTDIQIIVNDVKLKFANNAEAQRYIINIFGDLPHFRKFRTIDKDEGINLVDEGNVTLKKTLFSVQEDLFNRVKDRLLNKKNERERYQKTAVVYKHHPSENRLHQLEMGLQFHQNLLNDIEAELQERTKTATDLWAKKSVIEDRKRQLENVWGRTFHLNNHCPTCKQSISEDLKLDLLTEIEAQIKEIGKDLPDILEKLKTENDVALGIQQRKLSISKKINQLQTFKLKLETVLKQKDYHYTEKDIQVIKKALDELNKFSSYYLTEYIRVLEPLMNSVLSKIGFIIKFKLDLRGNFTFDLIKGSIKYAKEELSTGQKLILQIAFKLALLIQKNETGIIIADEGMASLDRDNLLHVIDLFYNSPFQLIFIIHNVDNLPYYMKVIDLGEKKWMEDLKSTTMKT